VGGPGRRPSWSRKLPPPAAADLPVWVLDTNVLVSGMLSAEGPPARLVDAVLGPRLRLALDDRIEEEYVRVLRRPKFSLDPARLEAVVALLAWQVRISAAPREGLKAPDPEDEKFLEVAAGTEDRLLVTGNLRHFPAACRGGVEVLSPAEAWKKFQAEVG